DGSDISPGWLALQSGVRSLLSGPSSQPEIQQSLTEERALDAAMKRDLPVGEPANLIAMVRRATSGGLRAILDADDEYDLSRNEVASKGVDLTFPADKNGKPLAVEVVIRVLCPGFDPPFQEKKIRVLPERASAACSF